MPISPPDTSIKRDLARKLFDTMISGIPVAGGPLAAIYSVTHPAQGEVLESQWRAEITVLVNDLEKAVSFLTSSISLTEDAAFLGKWIANSSETGGRFDTYDYEQIVAQFGGASRNEILEAVGELENNDMVSVSHCIGKPFSHLRPKHKLFEIFDPIIFSNVNPRKDAAQIVEKLLSKEGSISSAELVEEFGWSDRRINPAMAIVSGFVSEGRISSPMGQPYIVSSMFIDGSERASLRRFMNEVKKFSSN